MIQQPVPKDITKYETKVFGPFSKRQTLVIGIFALEMVFGLLLTTVGGGSVHKVVIMTEIMMAPCIITLMFGWVKIEGEYLDQYIRKIIRTSKWRISPERPYRSKEIARRVENTFDPAPKILSEKELKKLDQKLKTEYNIQRF